MKSIFCIVLFCVPLLPAAFCGTGDAEDEVLPLFEKLNIIAGKNGSDALVNGIFKPVENGFLGEGSCGFVYQGELLKPVRREVAMKFIPPRNKEFAEIEYTIYTCLNAINNTDVERYGIPAIYYYGKYKGYTMIGMTLLDFEFNASFRTFQFNEVDILVAFRDFVRTSKYIHSQGIHHNDIKIENLMFRRNQGFIIDFNVSQKMYETKDKNMLPATIRANGNWKQLAKDDWQRFFLTMSYYVGVFLDLTNFGANPKEHLQKILENLEVIEHPALKKVFNEFATHAFAVESESESHVPSHFHGGKLKIFHNKKSYYDQVYDVINEEIGKFKITKPVLVSWLEKKDLEKAKLELKNIPVISSITDRFEKVDTKYPEVHFDYFDKLKTSLSENEQTK